MSVFLRIQDSPFVSHHLDEGVPFKDFKGMTLKEFTDRHPETTERITHLVKATFPILSARENSDIQLGNCVAITDDLLLTASHCVIDHPVAIGPFKAEVIFDGSKEESHFKILKASGKNFKAVVSDCSLEEKDLIELSYKVNNGVMGGGMYDPFVTLVEQQDEANDFNRSFDMGARRGESGAPIMSLKTGHLHAIDLSGYVIDLTNRRLTIDEIYKVLQKASQHSPDVSQRTAAAAILKKWKPLQPAKHYPIKKEVGVEQPHQINRKVTFDKNETELVGNQMQKVRRKYVFMYTEIPGANGMPDKIEIKKGSADRETAIYAISQSREQMRLPPAAFRIPQSPRSPRNPRTPQSPRSPRTPQSPRSLQNSPHRNAKMGHNSPQGGHHDLLVECMAPFYQELTLAVGKQYARKGEFPQELQMLFSNTWYTLQLEPQLKQEEEKKDKD